MTNASVVTETMSDGSKAYNVALRKIVNGKPQTVATIAAEDKVQANRIADAINGASWIQFS